MWVQEGSDSKESDEPAPTHYGSPLFTRYPRTRGRGKQNVTTIGIPMKRKTPTTYKAAPRVNTTSDEKDREASASPPPLKSPISVSTPISPAQFLQNMKSKDNPSEGKNNDDDDDDDSDRDVPAFAADDLSDDDVNIDGETKDTQSATNDLWDLAIVGKKVDISSFTTSDAEDDDDDGDCLMTNNENELMIIGKKIDTSSFNSFNTSDADDEDEDKEGVDFDELPKEYYIPKPFDGLDIERASEWEQCLQCSGLLIVELYSTTFGASDVMFPFIDEMLHKRSQHQITFVRLRLHKLKQLDEIQEVLVHHASFVANPIPMYIFIKNGEVIDQLHGTQPTEFERLMDKYSKPKQPERPQTAPTKYKSVLTQRPPSSFSYTSSPVNNKLYHSANVLSVSRVENIRNLIKDLDITQPQSTRLSKNSSPVRSKKSSPLRRQ